MKLFLVAVVAGVLHLFFMLLELIPCKWPWAFQLTSRDLSFTPQQKQFHLPADGRTLSFARFIGHC